jgi:hypothetical protein
MWADSSKLALYALHGYLPSLNPGDHPGWTLAARGWLALTPWLAPARALHLLSAVCAAATVALAFLLGSSRSDAATGHSLAALLLVAHPLWWAATTTETYSLAALLVLATALAATPEASPARAASAGIASGLGLAVHGFTLPLTAPLLMALPPRRWLVAATGAVAGAAPLWLAFFGAPLDPLTGHHAAATSTWRWVLGEFIAPAHVVTGAALLLALVAFGLGPFGVAAVAGPRRRTVALHPRPALGALGIAALTLLLVAYAPYRLHLMALFPLLAIVILRPPTLGWRQRVAHIATQIGLYALVPFLFVASGHGNLGARCLPWRVNAWYFLCPIKAFDTGPERYAHALLTAVPHGAVVLADFNPGAVLRLVQEEEHLRPDVVVMPTVVDDALATPDPSATLHRIVVGIVAERRRAVLADRWEPYYRVRELTARGVRFAPCGPGLLVTSVASRSP